MALACHSTSRPTLNMTDSVYLPASTTHSHQSPPPASLQGQIPIGSSALGAIRQRWANKDTQRHQWAKEETQRHHLLLPKALPQGNLSRYFDLACVTAALRSLDGQKGAWEDAWLVLKHALPKLHDEGEFVLTAILPSSRQHNWAA